MAKNETPKFVTKKHQARLDRENTQRRSVLITTLVIAVLVILVIGYGILDTLFLQQIRPVAKVDGQAITLRDYENTVRYQRYNLVNQVVQFQQYGDYFTNYVQSYESYLNDTETLGKDVLDTMVNNVVIAQEAKTRNITVSEDELEAALEGAFAYYPNGTQTPTLTPTAFATGTPGPTQMALVPPTATPSPTTEPAITATPTTAPTATTVPTAGPTPTIEPTWTPYPTSTPVTEEGYKQLYGDYVTGIKGIDVSEKTLRDLYRANLLQKKMFEQITADTASIQEQVWARHILVATEDEAKAVLDRLNKGEDWNTVAAEVSTDTANKDNGGDLGWFPRGVMETAFEDAAFSLKIGEISQPVKSESGYHIIQVVDHEQERPLTTSMLDQLKQSIWSKWLEDAKAAKKIETYDDVWKVNIPTEPTVPAN